MATADPNSHRTLADVVDDVSVEIERTKRRELAEAVEKLERSGLTHEQEQIVATLAESITVDLTAPPLETLRTAAERGDERTVKTGRRVFAPDGPTKGQH